MPFLKTVVNQRLQGNDVKNILCWLGSDAVVANGQAFADEIRDIYLDTIALQLASDWSLESITVYDAEAADGTPGITFVPTLGPIVGVAGSTSLPNQVAGLVSFNCIGGPPWRGRTYLGGLAVNNVGEDGLWTPACMTQLVNFGVRLSQFQLSSGLAVGHAVIRKTDGVPIEDTSALVSSYIARDIPATQRRRRIGVGS